MRIAFLAFEGVEELDLVGPWEICSSLVEQGRINRAFVVSEDKHPLKCARGLKMIPDYSFDDCPGFNVLLVPGGPGRLTEVDNSKMIHFIQTRAAECRFVLSVCTGAFLLQRAGLLNGRRATTHWRALDELRALGVEVVEERWIRDGNIWTSSGVSAGMDLMLAFLAEEFGEDVAGFAQFTAEYFPYGKNYDNPEKRPEAPAYLLRDI